MVSVDAADADSQLLEQLALQALLERLPVLPAAAGKFPCVVAVLHHQQPVLRIEHERLDRHAGRTCSGPRSRSSAEPVPPLGRPSPAAIDSKRPPHASITPAEALLSTSQVDEHVVDTRAPARSPAPGAGSRLRTRAGASTGSPRSRCGRRRWQATSFSSCLIEIRPTRAPSISAARNVREPSARVAARRGGSPRGAAGTRSRARSGGSRAGTGTRRRASPHAPRGRSPHPLCGTAVAAASDSSSARSRIRHP